MLQQQILNANFFGRSQFKEASFDYYEFFRSNLQLSGFIFLRKEYQFSIIHYVKRLRATEHGSLLNEKNRCLSYIRYSIYSIKMIENWKKWGKINVSTGKRYAGYGPLICDRTASKFIWNMVNMRRRMKVK